MNILFLTSRLPYPPYRGDKLKIYNIIKELFNQGHQITILSFIASKNELNYLPELQKYCVHIETVLLPMWKSLFNCFKNIFSKEPFQVAYYKSKLYKKKVNDLLALKKFDIVHVHLIRMAQYMINNKYNVAKILDLTDAGSLYLERFLHTMNKTIFRIPLRVELNRLKNYERNIKYFEKNFVCSEIDQNHLQKNSPEANIQLLYNGVDIEYFSNNNVDKIQNSNKIIFTGNLSYFPNSDAVLYFTKEIFPIIKSELPDVKFLVVGQDPPKKVRKISSNSIIVTGFVPDIKKYYIESTIAVAPIRFGAGTLNKILEPMTLGIPVVATPISVEGLPVTNEKDILIASSAEKFAEACIRLIKDEELRRSLSKNAVDLVRNRYSWNIIVQNLIKYYQEVASKYVTE